MAEFCAEQVSDFELSADGKLFTSAEELRLLYHVMESTPYDTVRLWHNLAQNNKYLRFFFQTGRL